ncbi:MAG: TIM44-like domain-containing protein [Methylocystis sp.]|uniref:TIM44-like domain-containing protein n=1 Tax=Methylocystis sp. TaxID=1911079 RepID=UPI003D135402
MSRFFMLKRGSLISLALALLLALAPAIAEARMGRGGSFGSRGFRTWSAPPSTRTMPGTASPFDRSAAPRPAPGMASPMGQPRGAFGGSFGRGLMGGLAGGLLGAGLIGLLTGHGLFGGMMGFASVIGLLLQIALLVFLARLAFNWFARRNANVMAGAGHRPSPGFTSPFMGRAPFGAAGFGSGAAPEAAMAQPIRLAAEDFNAFERLLGETQAAYSREDIGALRAMSTAEMASYFDDELEENRRKGVANRVSDVKLLQGDLSEAWREGVDEYATVAMRFALNDEILDRATGKPAPGSPGAMETTEAWTFHRPSGAGARDWKLSAIQQAA